MGSNMKNSFSYQWKKWGFVQYESRNIGKPMEGHTRKMWDLICEEEDLSKKFIVDLGCGSGRFLEIALEYGCDSLIGIDNSEAALVAGDHYLSNDDVIVLRVNITRTGLSTSLYDGVYSIGVLHHTGNPKAIVKEAYRILKPGGWFALCVYPKGSYYDSFSVRLWRKIFSYTGYWAPRWYSLVMGRLVNPICRKIPVLRMISKIFPFAQLADDRWSELDTFDSLTPEIQTTHTTWEVYQWLEEAGFKKIWPTNFCSTSFKAIK